MNFRRPTAAHLFVFACSFSMVGVCTALALRGGATPLAVVTLRSLGSLAVLLTYFRLARVPLALSFRDRLITLGIGIPLCLNTYFINAAIAEIPVPLVVLIFYLWPAAVSTTSWLLGIERFRWRTFFGLVLAFGGLALALNVKLSATQVKGVVFALVSAVSWASVFLLMNRFFRGRDTRPVTLQMIAFAAAVFTIASVVAGSMALPTVPEGWFGIAGVTFFYSFGTIGLFAATVYLGAMRTGFFMNFEPVATLIFSALILGQHLSRVQLAGAALVVAALFLFRPPPGVAVAFAHKP